MPVIVACYDIICCYHNVTCHEYCSPNKFVCKLSQNWHCNSWFIPLIQVITALKRQFRSAATQGWDKPQSVSSSSIIVVVRRRSTGLGVAGPSRLSSPQSQVCQCPGKTAPCLPPDRAIQLILRIAACPCRESSLLTSDNLLSGGEFAEMLHQLTYLHSMAGLTLAEVPIFVQEMLEGGGGEIWWLLQQWKI